PLPSPLSLHDALPISLGRPRARRGVAAGAGAMSPDWEDDKPRSDDPFTSPFGEDPPASDEPAPPEEDERFEWRLRDEEEEQQPQDRKSTRLNSSHVAI